VALVRGQRWASLAELVPLYGWVLHLRRGLPAFFILPAWLSLDLFSMMLFPAHRTSYACHVGGALAGIGFAVLMRATNLPSLLDAGPALASLDLALAPAVRRSREANRPSRWPEGSLSGVWFVLSLAGALALSVGTVALGSVVAELQKTRHAQAWRARMMGTPPLKEAPFDMHYEHELFSVAYPSLFWTCGRAKQTEGPCAGRSMVDGPNSGALELVRPEAIESIHILALRRGIDRRSDLVSSLADAFAAKLKDKVAWRLLDTRSGTCHGPWSVESLIAIGEGETGFRMWSCTFSKELDLYHFTYVLPEVLRERDEAVLERILRETALPVVEEAAR
jgi:hypothetical protein